MNIFMDEGNRKIVIERLVWNQFVDIVVLFCLNNQIIRLFKLEV